MCVHARFAKKKTHILLFKMYIFFEINVVFEDYRFWHIFSRKKLVCVCVFRDF